MGGGRWQTNEGGRINEGGQINEWGGALTVDYNTAYVHMYHMVIRVMNGIAI